MANQSVLELAVGTGKWDAGLKKAKQSLDNFTQANGGLQQALGKDSESMQKFVRMMGQMDSTAKTAKGQMNDYKSTIEQLTMQYNRMTDAQKKVIGQDYLQAIEQMKQKYQSVNEEIQEMNRSLNNVKLPDMKDGGGGLFSGLGDKMGGALQVFAGNMLTKAAGAVASLGSEMADMVKQGVEMAKAGEGIRIAFERLGRGDILDGLREATHGTVTDIELMKAAVKFNDFKLPLDELGTMLAFAQQKAKDTGQSVDYMVDSIVTGLGRKSLMILDNLGLSATEVKEKMAETGDMTKAVGEIIREQMAKAGDYVETAADRATQANVSLQNKMEELGRKFAPLQEASNNFWTSMKIGILDVIGGPLTNLLNRLTEAGRLMNAYGQIGGSGKVGRMIQNLSNAREENRQSIYQQQQSKIWDYINRRENYMKDRQRWVNSGGQNEDLRQSLIAQAKSFGTSNVNDIKAQIDAAKKMLADYQQAAKQILQPIKQDVSSPTLTSPTSGGKGGNTEMESAIGSIDYQTKKVQELQKAWRAAADDDSRQKIKAEIEEQQYVLDRMTGKEKFDPSKMGQITNLPTMSIAPKMEIPEIKMGVITPLKALEDQLESLKKAQEEFGGVSSEVWQNYQQKIDEVTGAIDAFKGKGISNDAKVVTASFKDAASAVGNLGSALSGLDDPGAKIAGTVAQAIANIALAFSSADLKDGETGNVWYWIAATAAGLATMVSTISSIHAATNYAQGGIVKGNSYSGDNIGGLVDGSQFVGLNAGEVVLNAAQQSTLANNLQQAGGSLSVHGVLRGEDIVMVADRYGMRTGRGELAFWK
jgi:hypothetical protein